MASLRQRSIKLSDRTLGWFIRWRRVILIPFFMFFALIEIVEYFSTPDYYSHLRELGFYFALLILVALLLELALRALRLQQQATTILNIKHKISLEVMTQDNWGTIVSRLASELGQIAGVREVHLFARSTLSNRIEYVSRWAEQQKSIEPITSPLFICQHCEQDQPDELRLTNCKAATPRSDVRTHCLPVLYRGELYSVVKFFLRPDQELTGEQRRILSSLGDEIAIALKAGQDRKALSELQIVRATLDERRTVSQFLHDNLGQNIGFLRMKLDQFSQEPARLAEENIQSEITLMRNVAEESYQIVRSKMESIHSDASPVLTNLLLEHAKKMSSRSGFEFLLETRGDPRPVSIDVQRAVFYVFQEALSNIEKHAQASKVEVSMHWGKDRLTVSITDNGIGFDPEQVREKKRLGMVIVRERMEKVNGKIDILSSENAGTTIKIGVPVKARKRAANE